MASIPSEPAVKHLLTTLVPAWDDRDVGRIDYLSGGYTNRNYRVEVAGRRYVLRIVERGRPRPCERDYLEIDVAPDVVAYDSRNGHLLTHWIDGRVLADAPPTPEEAGAYLADLHSRIPHGLNRYDFAREVTAMFRQAAEVDPAVRDCFEQTAWRPNLWCGCHNDLNPWNIIREANGALAGRFRTLDWESAGDNDPLFDLVGLCIGLEWGFPEARICHQAYCRAGREIRASPARIKDTFRAFLIREYAWAAAQLAIGNDRNEIRAQVAKSREALARWG